MLALGWENSEMLRRSRVAYRCRNICFSGKEKMKDVQVVYLLSQLNKKQGHLVRVREKVVG